MSKKCFVEKYPEVYNYIISLPVVEKGSAGKGVNVSCCSCGKVYFKTYSNIYRDDSGDGKFWCRGCSNRKVNTNLGEQGRVSRSLKSAQTKLNNNPDFYKQMGGWSEGRDKQVAKMVSSKKVSGYFASDKFHENQIKIYETRIRNNTNFLEVEIQPIIDKFPGGYHAPAGTVHSDMPGESWIPVEMDIYYPSKKLAIEIDTPDHRDKREGYHKWKRTLLQNHGIKVLNIAVNRSNVYCEHPRRPGYTFMSLIEAFLDGDLPEEYEILWDDPWYING